LKTALNSKLPKLVQPAPLESAKVFVPSVEDMGTPTPSFDASSNMAASTAAYLDEGYNYRDRYGGYQATCYNSSQVDDREHHARAEFRYQQATRRPTPAPGYVDAYSAPYSDPYAYGQGLRASNKAPQRESQAPLALDRMERILECIERASSASFIQLQSFIGQGELIFYILLKFLKFALLHCKSFPWSLLSGPLSVSTVWKEVGWPPVSLRPVSNHFRASCLRPRACLVPAARYSDAKMCYSKPCLVLFSIV
jgi:hypothetical protein